MAEKSLREQRKLLKCFITFRIFQVIIYRSSFFSNKLEGGKHMELIGLYAVTVAGGLTVIAVESFFKKYQFQSPIKKR